jgi:hypothetical protein
MHTVLFCLYAVPLLGTHPPQEAPAVAAASAQVLEASTALEVPGSASLPAAPWIVVQDRRAEFDRKLREARGDIPKLWELYEWCEAFNMRAEGRRVLRDILRVDEEEPRANELLGHIRYDGRWFPNQREVDQYKREKAAREAAEKGLVEWRGQWVRPEHVALLERGLVQSQSGEWMTPEDLEKLQAGWVRQDLEWIPPDQVDKITEGLWYVDGEWLSLEAANEHRSRLDQWWRIPGDHFVLYTTHERSTAEQILRMVDETWRDLVRFFGVEPPFKPHVLVLRSVDQYREFSGGVPNQRMGTEAHGMSSVHGNYFADTWIDWEQRAYLGTGVAYYDARTETGQRFGRHFVKGAAGLAFVEAIDPSPQAIGRMRSARRPELDLRAFYAEKRIPAALRYGAAAYVERYFIDRQIPTGGDSEWARKWSVSNILRQGGIDPVNRILEFEVDPADPDGGLRAINQTGLLVAFILDGQQEAVSEAHAAFRTAMLEGGNLRQPLENLFKAVRDNEAAMRRFAER